MNIDMFKKDLGVEEFLHLVIEDKFGYKYKLNTQQLFYIKDSIAKLYTNIGNYIYYIYDNNVLCYDCKIGNKIKYIDSLDLNKYIKDKKDVEHEFKDISVSVKFNKHNYHIDIIYGINNCDINNIVISVHNVYSYNKELIEIVGFGFDYFNYNKCSKVKITMGSMEYGKIKLTFSKDEIVEDDKTYGIRKILFTEVKA